MNGVIMWIRLRKNFQIWPIEMIVIYSERRKKNIERTVFAVRLQLSHAFSKDKQNKWLKFRWFFVALWKTEMRLVIPDTFRLLWYTSTHTRKKNWFIFRQQQNKNDDMKFKFFNGHSWVLLRFLFFCRLLCCRNESVIVRVWLIINQMAFVQTFISCNRSNRAKFFNHVICGMEMN